jgi:hypothetical protein
MVTCMMSFTYQGNPGLRNMFLCHLHQAVVPNKKGVPNMQAAVQEIDQCTNNKYNRGGQAR